MAQILNRNQEHMSPQDSLAHYGKLGMKWGIRNDRPSGLAPGVRSEGVTARADGSISIAKGASLQRLVRSNGKSLPMKDLTFASANAYDNARYVKTIGGKGFFGGGRDQIASITATKRIEAPSHDEATRIVSELMVKSAQFRAKNTNMLGESISAKDLAKLAADPTGKLAKEWYFMTNQKMTFDKDFDPDAPYVQKTLRETLESKGYNALRDENDFSSGIARAPIIIFSPETSLKVISITDITDALRQANKEKLRQYKKYGEDWVERELYGS